MDLRSICDGHWKLQADGVATIGADLIPVGDMTGKHVAGKFGNGFNNLFNSSIVYNTVINPTNPNNCIIAYWLRPSYSISDGLASVGGQWVGHFSYWVNDNNSFFLQSTDSGNGTVVYFVVGGVWIYWATGADLGFGQLPQAQWNWSIGADVFFMHCFNPSGIGGTVDTYRLYINGIMAFNTSIAGLTCPSGGKITFGNMRADSDYGRPLNATLDNPMLFHDTSQEAIDDIHVNMMNEDLPSSGIIKPNRRILYPIGHPINSPINRGRGISL